MDFTSVLVLGLSFFSNENRIGQDFWWFVPSVIGRIDIRFFWTLNYPIDPSISRKENYHYSIKTIIHFHNFGVADAKSDVWPSDGSRSVIYNTNNDDNITTSSFNDSTNSS